jgi:3-deoxy-D-arabino-heptulosonate 7-phosphate (DAHP) synthase
MEKTKKRVIEIIENVSTFEPPQVEVILRWELGIYNYDLSSIQDTLDELEDIGYIEVMFDYATNDKNNWLFKQVISMDSIMKYYTREEKLNELLEV